jgi:hypothetical protein
MKKSKLATILLCWFFGYLGIHRFYVGKIWTGIFYLCTAGFGGVGVFIDMVRLLFNAFGDKEGRPLRNDIPTTVIVLLFIAWIILVCIAAVMSGLFELVGLMFI